MSDAIIQASNIDIPIADLYQTHFGSIDDLSTLWKIDEVLKKHIRKLEKTVCSKKRRVRDPNAPKKEASPQLLAWNEQVRRIVSISEQSTGGKIAYNHALKVGGILKAAGRLSINKEGNIIPEAVDVIDAVNSYHELYRPVLSVPVKAKKGETSSSSSASPNKQKEIAGTIKEESDSTGNTTTTTSENFDITTYTFIVAGKSYERGDIDGKAHIWDQKGEYMGVYDEKTKKFDKSYTDPTA